MRLSDRRQIPPLGTVRNVALPSAETFCLGNGVDVVHVHRPDSGLVGIEVLVRGGASTLEAHEAGLATLTADLLDEGAGVLESLELAQAIEAIGARMSTNSGYDGFHIRATAPSRATERLIELVADVTTRPRFAQADFERELSVRKARVLQSSSDPSNLADDAFLSVVYGEDPYGVPLMGTATTLGTLKREAVMRLYASHFAPQRTTLFVVGNAARQEIEPVLEKGFGDWKGSGPLRPLPGALTPFGSAPRIHLVDKPGASQSEIRVGRVGAAPDDPDVPSLDVLNTLLGGSFTSRLNSKLREEKGFTYGAFSVFTDNVRVGPFSAETAVHTPATAEAITDILNEFERLRTEPVPGDELQRAKQYLALRLPARFETTSQVLEAISELTLLSLPLDWYSHYVERVMAVTAADVGRMAKIYLDTSQVAVVVAGDRATIEAQLRELDREVVLRAP